MRQQRASELHRGSTFIHENWAYTVLQAGPHNPQKGLFRFTAQSPVETVEVFDFYDDMTRFVSTGDKVK